MAVQRLKVMEPRFFQNFQCAGDQCPDTCCRSWTVSVNKKAYKRLKKHQDVIVRQLVNDTMKLARKSEQEWAYIKMDEQGRCGAMDENGLCELHKRCGHSHLPDTCQEYPRRANGFGQQVEMSLFLSCPSAVENILFDPSAMMFEEKTKNVGEVMNGKLADMSDYIPEWLPIVRDFCFSLMLDPEASFDFKMFCLGYFLNKAQDKLEDVDVLNQFIDSFAAQYNQGELDTIYQSLPSVGKLKWHAFATQDTVLMKNVDFIKGKDDKPVMSSIGINFQEVRQELLPLLKEMTEEHVKAGKTSEEAQVEAFLQILSQADEQYLSKYYAENEQFLINYGLYFLYHEQFMMHKGLSLFDFFKVMAVHTLTFRVYMSAIAIKHKKLDKARVVKIYNAISRISQHKEQYIDSMLGELKNNKCDSVAQILGLFK